MHRADKDVVELIERTFLESGFNPTQGNWSDPDAPLDRCGLGSLLTPEQATSPFSHEIVSAVIDRSEDWVGFFILAFDEWPKVNDHVFSSAVYDQDKYDDRSRGYRAGWECAQRLFASPSTLVDTHVGAAA
jgi:hypothetical protein